MTFEYNNTHTNTLSSDFIDFVFVLPIFALEITKIPAINTKIGDKRILINLVGNKQIRELNNEFRSKDKETDILTFEYFEGDLAGEIYMNIDEIAANAKEMGYTLEREFLEIFIHGLLHMSGVDHGEYMFNTQKEYADKMMSEFNENNSRVR